MNTFPWSVRWYTTNKAIKGIYTDFAGQNWILDQKWSRDNLFSIFGVFWGSETRIIEN